MKSKLQQIISYTCLACLAIITLGSCDKVDELVNPKSPEEKTLELLVGTWKIDSTISRLYEQGRLTSSSVAVNRGTIEFQKGTPINTYGYRPQITQFTDTAGVIIKREGFWCTGNWFSSGINDGRITLFYNPPGQAEFNSQTGVVYDFGKKEKNNVVINGGSGSTTGGITVRSETRWVLSR